MESSSSTRDRTQASCTDSPNLDESMDHQGSPYSISYQTLNLFIYISIDSWIPTSMDHNL